MTTKIIIDVLRQRPDVKATIRDRRRHEKKRRKRRHRSRRKEDIEGHPSRQNEDLEGPGSSPEDPDNPQEEPAVPLEDATSDRRTEAEDRFKPKSPPKGARANILSSAIYVLLVAVVTLLVTALLSFYGHKLRTSISARTDATCRSEACKAVASDFNSMLNNSIAPCDDFYLYACGGWLSRNRGRSSYLDDLNEKLLEALNNTVYSADRGEERKNPFWNMLTFYRSCYDFHVNAVPLPALVRRCLDLLRVTMAEWLQQNDSSSLFFFVVRTSLVMGMHTIYRFTVVREDGGTVLHISAGTSVVKKLENSTRALTYLKDVTSLTDPILFNQTIRSRLLEFEKLVVAIEDEGRGTGGDKFTAVPVTQLPEVKEKLVWTHWLEAINVNLNGSWKLSKNDAVLVFGVQQVRKLTKAFFAEDTRVAVLYVYVQALTELLRFDYFRENSPHFTCLSVTYRNFPDAFETFAVAFLSENSVRGSFTSFITNIRRKLEEMASSSPWMEAETTDKAVAKLRSVRLKMVQQGELLGHAAAPAMTSHFLRNYVQMLRYKNEESIIYPRPPTDPYQLFRLLTGDVRYSPKDNSLLVPVVMMRSPLYIRGEEEFYSHMTVGARIASAMSLAVSEYGSRFDSTGLEVHWWSEKVQEEYNRRMKCYLDNYFNRLKIPGNVTVYLRDALYSTAHGLAVAISMTRLADSPAKPLFFGRYCQQFCRTKYETQPVPLAARHQCEFAVINQPMFHTVYKCTSQSRLGAIQRCEVF